MKLSLFLGAVAGIVFHAAPARGATIYTFTKLTLNGAVAYNQDAGINNNGVVASKSGDQVFTFDGTNYTYYSNLDWLNTSYINEVAGVDNAGDIAFNYFSSPMMYFTSTNTVTGIYMPVNGDRYVSSISSSGQIIGGSYSPLFGFGGFGFEKSGNSALDVVSGLDPASFAMHDPVSGVNDSGDAVGVFPGWSWLRQGNTTTRVLVAGSADTQAHGLNDQGQVVGSYDPGDGSQHGFLWTNGTTSTVDYPDATSVWLDGINSQGVILGGALDQSGNAFLFLATPQAAAATPEPGGTMLVGIGLGLVGLARLRRRKRA